MIWVSARMAVSYHTTIAGDQVTSITTWVEAHAFDAIDRIDVYERSLSMHGRNSDQQDSTQSVVRSGDLTADLDEVFRRLWRLEPAYDLGEPSGGSNFD